MIRLATAKLSGVDLLQSVDNPGQTPEREARLVAAAGQGDQSAFEMLYKKTGASVYWLCLRLCGDQRLAEELTQEAYIRCWQSLQSFRKDCSFESWLRTIARRVCIDYFRRKNAGLWALSEPLNEVEHCQPGGVSQEDWWSLEKIVASLPDGARQILVLHDIEGLTHQEIANLCGIKEGTSKAQLARARKLIKAKLRSE